MPIDPSIPLGAQAPQFDITRLAELAQFAKQNKTQNALKALLNDPANIDPATGLPSTQAIQKIMAVDPMQGMKLAESNVEIQQRMQQGKQKEYELYLPIITTQKDALANLLGPRIQKDGLAKAVESSRADYAESMRSLRASGVPDSILGQLPKDLTPELAQNLVAAAISPEKKADLTERAKSGERQEKTETERERHDRETERLMGQRLDNSATAATQKGWKLFQDEAGGSFRSNANTGKTQKMGDDGEWGDIDKLPSGVHVPGGAGQPKFDAKTGELMAALAEQGVSLPTGFRSKEQQVALYKGILERNPDLSPDEIATKLKTGQIEFGAQKKETQTAAGVAGKVEVAENEIQEFVPLVREASKKIPRGKFVPLNKLMQMADSSISDPDLKELKVYINSTLNAYDMLAARGGTDKDKRAENRALLLAAESPEALERGLSAFEKEAAAAHRAAVKATKVPELEGSKKPTGKDAGATDHSKMSDDELKKMLGLPQ